MNIASKILAFVAAFTLFLPQQPASGPAPQPGNNEQADPPAALAEFTYYRLFYAERTRLDQLTLVATESRAGADLGLGHHRDLAGDFGVPEAGS
jgi:hypothetical protein